MLHVKVVFKRIPLPLPPLKPCCQVELCFWTVPAHILFHTRRLWYRKLHKRQLCYCTPDHLAPIFVLYCEGYVKDKTWCEYESNQTTGYALNPGLITK